MGESRLVAGAMSGTSADGVDVAIARVSGRGYDMSPTLLRHHHHPYEPSLRASIFEARAGKAIAMRDLAELGRAISLAYADAVNEAIAAANIDASELACIAAHGQTLFHDPPLTIQWLDPALLAARTRCAVVSDFRRADCAAGGQGAPLVPFADFVLFRHAQRNRVLVNIGGIANITFVPARAELSQVLAFDTGPGNCISDWLMRRHEPDGLGFDENGTRASQGKTIGAVVQGMLSEAYFRQSPPKSTDGPAMIAIFEHACGRLDDHQPDDLLATACRITAVAMTDAIRRLPARVDELIVSGGGIGNRAIMAELQRELPAVSILTSDELGLVSQAKEALAFALLGLATIDGIPANVPSATGAARAVVLGCITPRP